MGEAVMKARSIITILVSAALSFLLSGCLVSNTPLITAANSDRPLPAHFSISRNGNTGAVDLAGDNSYVFTDPHDSTDKVSLHFKKIADNLYAVSQPMIVKETGALRGYQYGYVQVAADGSKIVIQWPDCKEFEVADIEKMGVKIEKEEDGTPAKCHIPSIEVLATILRNYIDDPKNVERIKSHEENGTFYIIAK
jgi:hypothetical protein